MPCHIVKRQQKTRFLVSPRTCSHLSFPSLAPFHLPFPLPFLSLHLPFLFLRYIPLTPYCPLTCLSPLFFLFPSLPSFISPPAITAGWSEIYCISANSAPFSLFIAHFLNPPAKFRHNWRNIYTTQV